MKEILFRLKPYVRLKKKQIELGLEIINMYTDFESISNAINPTIFRLETLGLVVYLVLLTIYYNKSKDQLR